MLKEFKNTVIKYMHTPTIYWNVEKNQNDGIRVLE